MAKQEVFLNQYSLQPKNKQLKKKPKFYIKQKNVNNNKYIHLTQCSVEGRSIYFSLFCATILFLRLVT